MKLTKIVTTEDGNIETTWVLAPEQYYSLLQHAINDLTLKGVIESVELSEEDVKQLHAEALTEARKTFLEQVPVESLPQS
jgi:hypothetical protein